MLPGSLVLELAGQFSPRGVSDGLGQFVVLEHPSYIEALHADDVVVLASADSLCTGMLVEER